MTRTIKFRAISECNGEGFVYGDLLHTKDGRVLIYDINGLGTDVNPNTVCQYTGVNDKNGKEIYEGDIIEFRLKPDYKVRFICKVEYHKGGLYFVYKEDYADFEYMELRGWDSYEVIGNIFDNPQLLKNDE